MHVDMVASVFACVYILFGGAIGMHEWVCELKEHQKACKEEEETENARDEIEKPVAKILFSILVIATVTSSNRLSIPRFKASESSSKFK